MHLRDASVRMSKLERAVSALFSAVYIKTIFINCSWVVTRWQWLFCKYTKYEIGY